MDGSQITDIDAKIAALDVARETLEGMRDNRVLIERALSHGYATHTFDEVVELVTRGELFWRDFDNCFFVIQMHRFPRFQHYHIWLAGGDLEGIEDAILALADEARQWGCKRMTISGRPGWKRILEKYGAYTAQHMMGMEV